MNKPFPYRKILIVGCGGAGKSTFARKIGTKFTLPVVHLDRLWWLPNWVNRSKEEFDEMLQNELKKPAWIMDGNFFRTFKLRLKYADFCIFLDFDTETCLKNVYARAEEFRGKTRPDMTDGCIERIDEEFEQWIRNYQTQTRPAMLEILGGSDVPHIVFKTREDTENWLNQFY